MQQFQRNPKPVLKKKYCDFDTEKIHNFKTMTYW